MGSILMQRPRVCLSFDGVDDYVQVANNAALDMASQVTVEFWMFRSSLRAGTETLVTKRTAVTNANYEISMISGTKFLSFFGAGTPVSTSYVPPLHRWVHIACVSDGSDTEFFVDAVSIGTVGRAIGPVNIGDLYLAKVHNSSQWSAVRMSDVRLWSVKRTADQIAANFTRRLVRNESGLAGYWPLNYGQGTVARDLTANANNGTITGASWALGGVIV